MTMLNADTNEEMPGALKVKVEKVRELLAEATPRDSQARHRVGVIVCEIEDSTDKYGSHAVERLANELGLDRTTLYEMANVARRWPLADFKPLSTRVSSRGVPLSFSHFIELAAVKDGRSRHALLERAFVQGLSVRALSEAIQSRQAQDADEGGDEAEISPRKTRPATLALTQIVASVDDLAKKQAQWKEWLAGLPKVKSTKSLAAQIEDAIERSRAQQSWYAENLELLEAEKERVESDLKAARS